MVPVIRRGRPPRINRNDVIEAATALADGSGMDAVSLRAVARSLGVAPVTLYTYVSSADELLDLVVARLVERSAGCVDWPVRWDEILVVFCHELRLLLERHPMMLETYRRRTVSTGPAIDAAEVLLAALCEAGLDIDTAVAAYGALHAFVIGYTALEQGQGRPSPNVETPVGEDAESPLARTHPTLAKAQPGLNTYFSRPDNFAKAVDWFVAGIRADLTGGPPTAGAAPSGYLAGPILVRKA